MDGQKEGSEAQKIPAWTPEEARAKMREVMELMRMNRKQEESEAQKHPVCEFDAWPTGEDILETLRILREAGIDLESGEEAYELRQEDEDWI